MASRQLNNNTSVERNDTVPLLFPGGTWVTQMLSLNRTRATLWSSAVISHLCFRRLLKINSNVTCYQIMAYDFPLCAQVRLPLTNANDCRLSARRMICIFKKLQIFKTPFVVEGSSSLLCYASVQKRVIIQMVSKLLKYNGPDATREKNASVSDLCLLFTGTEITTRTREL